MYTLISNVPFRHCRGKVREVASDWAQSLILLCDSLNGRFGEITVAAPELAPGDGPISQRQPQKLTETEDGVRFAPLGDTRWRARPRFEQPDSTRGYP